MENLEIKVSKNGRRGVFTKIIFETGQIIEIAPLIIIPIQQSTLINQTILYDYYFSLDSSTIAIALGYGSLYNHSYNPNAIYEKNPEKLTITFKSIKKISNGEEITINYNGKPEDKSPLWFKVD